MLMVVVSMCKIEIFNSIKKYIVLGLDILRGFLGYGYLNLMNGFKSLDVYSCFVKKRVKKQALLIIS